MRVDTAIKKGIIGGIAISAMMMTVVTFGILNRSAGANVAVTGPRDCDSNAIIHCGALSTYELQSHYAANKTGDLPQIYQHFGISSADIASLDNKVSVGAVKADGTVWIGDKLIGVNARSSGRNKTPESVAVPGTNVYKRPPSDSFVSSSTTIKIFVGYKGDVASYAIMSSCGNPLMWDKPELDVQKTVSRDGSSWKENEKVQSGDTVEFRLQIKETTARAAVHDVAFTDDLPAGYTFVPGSLRIDGVATSATVGKQSVAVGAVPKDGVVTVAYKVVIDLIGKECGSMHLVNTAHVSGLYVGSDSDTASTDVTKGCDAVFSCKVLTHDVSANPKPNDVVTFRLMAGPAEHTIVKAYVFMVNDIVVQQDTRDTFAYTIPGYGPYTVEGRIRTAAGDTTPSAGCMKTFDVKQPAPPEPPKPKLVSCTSLNGASSLTVGHTEPYTVTTSDATRVASYSFEVNGDQVGSNGATLNYTPLNPGQYTIIASITPKPGSTIDPNVQGACSKTVVVRDIITTSCQSLTTPKLELRVGEPTTVTAAAEAQGASVDEYIFSVNGTEMQRSASSTYRYSADTKGDHTIKVTVKFSNGDMKSSTDCEKTIKVTEEIITACRALTGPVSLKAGGVATYTAEATAAGTSVDGYIFELNGAKVQSGSGNEYVLTGVQGAHTIRVTATFVNGDSKTSDNCVQQVRVDKTVVPVEEPEEEIKVCRGDKVVTIKIRGRINSDTDAPCPVPVVVVKKAARKIEVCRGGEHIAIIESQRIGSDTDAPCPEVKGELVVVQELPNTGAGADTVAGVMTAFTGAGAMAHRKHSIRRRLKK